MTHIDGKRRKFYARKIPWFIYKFYYPSAPFDDGKPRKSPRKPQPNPKYLANLGDKNNKSPAAVQEELMQKFDLSCLLSLFYGSFVKDWS